MIKLVIVNGSPRPQGNTYKALMAEKEYLKNKHSIIDDEIVYFQLPVNFQGCMNCPVCNLNCNIKDKFQEILEAMDAAEYMLLGSPVYLDMPTAQTVAFLTRLNCRAENTGREFFRNKKALLLATSYCSGTKSVIHTMMGACEMLGFTIEGRSTREYVGLWKDNKVRGGMNKSDSVYLDGMD